MKKEKGEVILLSTENSHSTQQMETEATEEEEDDPRVGGQWRIATLSRRGKCSPAAGRREVFPRSEEEMSGNDTPSENTDEEDEEEYWQRAGKNQISEDEETDDHATIASLLP